MKKRVAAALAGIMIITGIIAFGIVFSVDEVTEVYEKGAAYSGLASGDIAQISGIHLGDNIFGIDENAAAKKVAARFPDHSVVVQDIERVFPDKVIIRIKQRIPIVAVAMASGGYALADIDFQLDKRADEVDFSLYIAAPDVVIDNSFHTESCIRLRAALLAVKACGFCDEAIAAFVQSIRFSGEYDIYTLRTGATITVAADANLNAAFMEKYNIYLQLPETEKAAADL
jgi:hypothetical protein